MRVKLGIPELRERWNNGIGVPLILKKHLLPNTRKVLVFCKNIKQLQQVRSVVHQWFLTIYTCKVNMYELHTEFNQRSVFDEFERPKNNEIDVLLSINMLCEGIHTKGIDAVVMLRDTVSPNVYFQQLGRCLTVQRDTTPVVFDMVNNLDNIRMDDFVREYNATCRALLGDHKSAEPNEQRFRVIDELQDWRVLYQKTMDISEKWDAMYAKLKEHYNQHGTLRLYLHPRHEQTRWCAYVRMRHRQGRLSEDQVRKLNEIEFIWEDRCQDAWNRRYDELCAFYHEHGHSNVSAILNKSLLGWCRAQKRRKLERGLSLEQIEKLDAVNFNWVIQKSDWHKWYAQLKEFFEQNGHCRIVGNGRSLRGWCVRTRALYHQNKLSQEQIRLMEQLNFS